jgi:hypothetical protein
MANKDFKVKNGLDIQSPLPVSMGGTGQTSTTNTLNSLLPTQDGNSNKVLATDGTNTTWVAQAVAYQRGGTASRPVSPTAGDLYYNTDTNIFEQYTSSGWFAIAAAPSAPTSVVATNSGSGRAFNNGSASVAFSAGTSGGAPNSFVLTPTPTTSPSTFTSGTSPITVTNLASSTQYTYTVTASSAYGTSSASSASTAVTATTVPQAPSITSVTGANAEASIAFSANATGGSAITEYTITSSPGNITASGSSSPIVVTGLTNGTAYTFTAVAINTNGTSAASSESNSVTPILFNPEGAYDALASIDVGSAGYNIIQFTSIPTGYKHLQLRWISRSSGGSYNPTIQFNEDTGANYSWHYLDGNGASATGGGASSQSSILLAGIDATANTFATGIYDILDYANINKNKTFRGLQGGQYNTTGSSDLWSGAWYSTAAINSISLNFYNTEFSSFALYGVK